MPNVTPSPQDFLRPALSARLSAANDQVDGAALADDLLACGGHVAAAVLSLLDELEETSRKGLTAAVAGLAALRQRQGLTVVVPWLDLGIAIAQSSGATALKYFQESPLLIQLLPTTDAQERTLQQGLELAERDANIALEWVRQAPSLLSILPAARRPEWAEIGLELADVDYVVGVEFFRQSPAIAEVIPLGAVRAWIAFALKLITPNSLGKTDYVGTLEFLRSSPRILGGIASAALRKQVIDLGSLLADRDPAIAIRFLAESPSILERVPSEEWCARVLSYGALVAERDPDAAWQYVQRCPDILTHVHPGAEALRAFEEWFRGGMEVLELSVEGGRAYFALETHQALAAVEQAGNAVPLRQVARMLKLFAEGLCGRDITIHALAESGDPSPQHRRAVVGPDRRTIGLPAVVNRYHDRAQNLGLYLAMVTHEAGHLEFGTYEIDMRALGDVVLEVRSRYGAGPDVRTLEDLFRYYPHPALIRDLWTILEDARIEYRLQLDYPGLAKALAMFAQEAVTPRSLTHGMTVKELVVECLLLLTTAEPATVRIPDAIEPIMTRAWDLVRHVLTPTAVAEEAIRTAHHVYVLLEEMVGTADSSQDGANPTEPDSSMTTGPAASESAGTYRPVTNRTYRGEMTPAMVADRSRQTGEDIGATSGGIVAAGTVELARGSEEAGREEAFPRGVDRLTSDSRTTPASAAAGSEHAEDAGGFGRHEEGMYVYDEWDGAIRDYRSRWCRVLERDVVETDSDFVEATLRTHGPSIRLMRRYFEALRPSGLRRMFAQVDGEELDLDATIRRVVDRAAGAEESDRIYIRRDRHDRDVAVAFLIDLSGSTSRRIEPDHRRIIDVEKEALIVLSEALEAIGDQYAIYGYSSQGRRAVDFWVLKAFDERIAHSSPRIGALQPLQQNRDGAAIRHAASKLRSREARTRLLVLISDGKPLDDGYTDEYALEDTKQALQEVRRMGIHPFCLTVDQAADAYVKRMYGDVHYIVIDRIAALPVRLPSVYQRVTA